MPAFFFSIAFRHTLSIIDAACQPHAVFIIFIGRFSMPRHAYFCHACRRAAISADDMCATPPLIRQCDIFAAFADALLPISLFSMLHAIFSRR